jgi:universal stress protein F
MVECRQRNPWIAPLRLSSDKITDGPFRRNWQLLAAFAVVDRDWGLSLQQTETIAMFTKVLVPVDLSETKMTDYAARSAQVLAKAFDADIRLVNVQSLVPVSFLDYVPQDFNETVRRGLEAELAAVAARIDRAPERISTILLFGPIYQNILSEAERWGSDIIVLCSHRPGVDRFLIGSNASAVVRHATCSVLVLR